VRLRLTMRRERKGGREVGERGGGGGGGIGEGGREREREGGERGSGCESVRHGKKGLGLGLSMPCDV
jgi:hypothetical protein